MNEQDKFWIKKCKEDWSYTIMVDTGRVYVVHTDTDDVVYTFSEYGYCFAKHLLQYLGCDADFV